MPEASDSDLVSTRQQRIAELARQAPHMGPDRSPLRGLLRPRVRDGVGTDTLRNCNLTSRMPEWGTSGSVGAPSRQLLGATRRMAKWWQNGVIAPRSLGKEDEM